MRNHKKAGNRKLKRKKRKKNLVNLPKGLRRRIIVIPDKENDTMTQNQDLIKMVDEFVEETLWIIRQYLKQGGESQVKVSDMEMSIPGGNVKLTNGHVQDLASLRQKGNFQIKTTAEGFCITGPLEFQNLFANFQYSVNVYGFGPYGKINVVVPDNTVHIRLFVKVDFKTCDDFDLKLAGYNVRVDLKELTVEATGLVGALNWLLSKIGTTLANKHKPRMTQEIEEKMGVILAKFVRGEL